ELNHKPVVAVQLVGFPARVCGPPVRHASSEQTLERKLHGLMRSDHPRPHPQARVRRGMRAATDPPHSPHCASAAWVLRTAVEAQQVAPWEAEESTGRGTPALAVPYPSQNNSAGLNWDWLDAYPTQRDFHVQPFFMARAIRRCSGLHAHPYRGWERTAKTWQDQAADRRWSE